jgi:Fe-S-cluster containining protein
MHGEYRALVAKVEAFAQGVRSRRPDALSCRRGCSACCETWLSVSLVEAAEIRAALRALSPAARERIAARGRRELIREQQAEGPPRCALLQPDGGCAVYAHRPLVCRTQGHALRYPQGFIPLDALRARTAEGEVTHCPLNYDQAPPAGSDVLDAERVDQILGLITHRFAEANGLDPMARVDLRRLAAEAAMLCDGSHERSSGRERAGDDPA